MAPGTDIAAARSSQAPLDEFWGAYPNNAYYAFMGAPAWRRPTLPAAAPPLVREYFVKQAGWATPSAALLKATLINGTRRLTGRDAIAALAGEPNFTRASAGPTWRTVFPVQCLRISDLNSSIHGRRPR